MEVYEGILFAWHFLKKQNEYRFATMIWKNRLWSFLLEDYIMGIDSDSDQTFVCVGILDEPVIFGLPIALNPIVVIPFILAPMATITFSYLTMKAGIFLIPVGIDMPWTTPILISGYISTAGNFMGVVLQIINFLCCVFCIMGTSKHAERKIINHILYAEKQILERIVVTICGFVDQFKCFIVHSVSLLFYTSPY